ncbi:MAG: hypothetical protein QOF42_670, partial [Gammaproteobacteria bacterium]|jgi:uncharacterized caspase-like protein|nr:hypothetical protein [Gammaproteobacteria bacterium]
MQLCEDGRPRQAAEVRLATLYTRAMQLIRLTLFTLMMLGSAAAGAAETRIALVIGNSNYASGPLPNPANDAQMMADTLGSLGFEVIARRNADQNTMKRAIQEFGSRLEKGGPSAVGLFYYAGHGVQLNGRNYLIPTTAQIDREGDVEIEAVSADWVIEQMRYARNRLNIVILDACRNNPFTRSMRSVDHGLATMDAPAGILIAYSTAPGAVAMDGNGRDSPYTEALSQAMRNQHEPVEQVFKHVRVGVMSATANKQVPWESSSLTGDFYFSGAQTAAVTAPNVTPAGAAGNLVVASAPVGTVPGSRALPMLKLLGLASGDMDSSQNYSQAKLRELLERGTRHVSVGNSPRQIEAAFALCQKYAANCSRSMFSDETTRTVALDPFDIDPLPVSVVDFRQFVEATHYRTDAEKMGYAYDAGDTNSIKGGDWRNGLNKRQVADESAVVAVSFQDALAYCKYKGQRLPTEDEWEFIARGPERHTFPWGENTALAAAALNAPPRVADGPAEGIGGRYHGLSGNVWQWVNTQVNGRKVLKGASWLETNPAYRRAATRRMDVANRADEDSGFRCAKSLSVWPDAELYVAQLK